MKVPGFVYEETPFCRLCNVTQTKIGNYFEPIVPGNPSEPNESSKTARFLPVQSYRRYPTERGELPKIFRLYEVFGIEEIVGGCGNAVAPQRSDAIEKTYGCELPEV